MCSDMWVLTYKTVIYQVGGRQGNLDRVVEHFLGPKSFLRTEDKQTLFDNLMKRWSETDAKVQGKLRGRRNVKTDIDNFDKHVSDISRSIVQGYLNSFRCLSLFWGFRDVVEG